MTAFRKWSTALVLGFTLLTASAVPSFVHAATPFDLTTANSFGAENIKPIGTTVGSIEELAAKIINFILGLLGIIAVILILVSGWQWMVAESEDKVKEASKRLMNSVIGLAIVALSWVIAYAIINSIAAITKNT